MVIKRELVGRWSSKGSWLGDGHQKGAIGEVVIRRELMGRWSQKRVMVGRSSSKGSLWGGDHQNGSWLGRWSSKGSWWGGGHQKRADGEVVTKKGDGGKVVIKRELMGR